MRKEASMCQDLVPERIFPLLESKRSPEEWIVRLRERPLDDGMHIIPINDKAPVTVTHSNNPAHPATVEYAGRRPVVQHVTTDDYGRLQATVIIRPRCILVHQFRDMQLNSDRCMIFVCPMR